MYTSSIMQTPFTIEVSYWCPYTTIMYDRMAHLPHDLIFRTSAMDSMNWP